MQTILKFAFDLAKTIKPPVVINLSGDLGAGKTTFTQGFLKGLGVAENVTSPTFTILNEYRTTFPIYHFDMYRIEDPEETQHLGFEEYFDLNTMGGVTLIEWAQNTPHLIPKKHLKIEINKLGDLKRQFIVWEVN